MSAGGRDRGLISTVGVRVFVECAHPLVRVLAALVVLCSSE